MWLSDFEKSQIIGTIGTPLYLDIFEDCFPLQIGYLDEEGIQLNIQDIPQQGIQVISSLDGGNHAMSILLDNDKREYRIFDSSRQINWEAHKILDRYLQGLGYESKSEICPIRYLPQVRDSLCILWSLFLLNRQCHKVSPYPTSINERSSEFRRFQGQIWDEAQKYLSDYYRFQQLILNMSLNNQLYSYDQLRRSFTAALNKDLWLQEHEESFRIRTSVRRTPYEASFLRYMLEYVYDYSQEAGEEYAIDAKNRETIQDMIDVLPGNIPVYHKDYLIYMILSILSLDSKNRLDIFYGRNEDVMEKYVNTYHDSILQISESLGFSPEELRSLNNYQLMEQLDRYARSDQELKDRIRYNIFVAVSK